MRRKSTPYGIVLACSQRIADPFQAKILGTDLLNAFGTTNLPRRRQLRDSSRYLRTHCHQAARALHPSAHIQQYRTVQQIHPRVAVICIQAGAGLSTNSTAAYTMSPPALPQPNYLQSELVSSINMVTALPSASVTVY